MRLFSFLLAFICFPLFFSGCERDASVFREAAPAQEAALAEDLAAKEAAEAAAKAEKAAAEALKLRLAAEEKAAAEAKEREAAEKAEAKEREAAAKAEAKEREAAEKAERERLEAKAEAAAKEAYEREEKLRLERKADEEARRKAITTRTYRLVYADAEEVAARFNATWSGDFGDQWKVLKVAQAFPEANAVMVTAPLSVVESCDEVVRQVDVAPRQVYIEARFVELSNNASHKLGIDWQMLDGMKGSLALDAGLHERKVEGISSYNSKDGSYTIGDSNGEKSTANLSYINGTIGMSELFVTLRALESSEDARVFSNPKIIVSSGKKATVDMTTKYPNVKISAKRTTNSGGDSLDLDMQMSEIPGEDKMMFAKESFFSWGISLDVTPRVGTNGVISVQIVPTISSQSDWVASGATDDTKATTISAKYPVIDVQRLVTDFDMVSGTTAVIGGLSRTVETQKDNGIPFLRDIWWLGPRIFGSRVRVKEQREIIVFVTVGLVDPSEIRKDAGLPKNAVLGRQYTDGIRREPGDRVRQRAEGLKSLDLRSLEEQYSDPRRTNRVHSSSWSLENLPLPFTQDPNYRSDNNKKEHQ